MAAGDDLSPGILPRVLIVSRRSVRKNKFVDFVGEYHLDLIVNYGAVPVIVPRVTGIHNLLESFEPIHGVLLCEGEDIDPSLYSFSTDDSFLSTEDLEEIKRLHTSDTTTDKERDRIELRLAKLCLERSIPYLGICRGSQVLNVASGGTLYQDVRKELTGSRSVLPHDQGDDGDGSKRRMVVMHIDYDNYDGHRHALKIVKNTPLHHWFKESLGGACDDDDDEKMEILVNSYHHQGVKRLASRFVAMGFAEDGLIEGFYDPNTYDPEQGKFVVGLQFHPERMRKPDSDEFDYPGCPSVYMEFVKAVTAYQRKQEIISKVPRSVKQQLFRSQETLEKKRKLATNPSYAPAKKDIYVTRICLNLMDKDDDDDDDELIIETAAVPELFVEYSNSSRCDQGDQQQGYRSRLIQMVRNGTFPYMDYKLRLGEESEISVTKEIMEMMSVEQLTDLMAFYHMMDQISSDVLQRKVGGINCK